MLPDADPTQLLEAFLTAHAGRETVPTVLYPRGEELYHRLAANPPADPRWGRFLIAMGQLAADHFDDGAAASRYFLQALQGVSYHGDHEAAVTAGYNQGVLQERRHRLPHALAAYRAAAEAGFRAGVVVANTVRAAHAAVRLRFAEDGNLGDLVALCKQGWLAWLYLRVHDQTQLDDEVEEICGLHLAALLLPEDQPSLILNVWRAWTPNHLMLADGSTWDDANLPAREALLSAAADAADRHLSDEGPNPGEPYRLLLAAVRRSG